MVKTESTDILDMDRTKPPVSTDKGKTEENDDKGDQEGDDDDGGPISLPSG